MATVYDLIETTRSHLHGTYRPEFNFLDEAIDDTATSLTVEMQPRGIDTAAVIGIDDELLFVKGIAGQTVTVARGWLGTTAEEHAADATIEVNPRFPRHMIKNALQEEIRSWGDSLYRVDWLEVSVGTNGAADLTISNQDFYRILEVRQSPYSSSVRATWPLVRHWEVDRHASPSDFPNGVALHISEPLKASSPTVKVIYAGPFDLTYFSDDIHLTDDIGLPVTAHDIPPLGAAWRLLAPREVPRTYPESQGSRNPDEVPVGSVIRTAAALKTLRDQRLVEESNRLVARIPLRF